MTEDSTQLSGLESLLRQGRWTHDPIAAAFQGGRLTATAAVVTHGTSDWSVAPVPDWAGREVSMRASRSGDAVTIRARVQGEDWRLVRVAHLDAGAHVWAGLYCAAPTRAGLAVTFTGYRTGGPDTSLH